MGLLRLLGVASICLEIIFIGNQNLALADSVIDILVVMLIYIILIITEYLKTKGVAGKINQRKKNVKRSPLSNNNRK